MSLKDIKEIIPIEIRKKIKNTILNIFGKKLNANIIDNITKKEWGCFRNNKKFDLIELSIISWDYRFQRPQQISAVLSQLGNRIFYIENEFIPTKKSEAPFIATKKIDNIYTVTLSASKNLFIYSDIPSKKDINIVKESLNNLIKTAKIQNPIIKIDHPFWSYFLGDINIPIIYDCMDLHEGFAIKNKNIRSLEAKTIKQSNQIITTSEYLKKYINKKTKKKVYILKNGADYNLFSNPQTKKNIDVHLKKYKKIIGYYGAINEWIDENVIEIIASQNPEFGIVLIGRVQNQKITKLSKKYKNIILLGEKPYLEIPTYLKLFDVCLIPFKLTKLIKATNPVKLYEYFSQGKPILCSEIPEIKIYKSLVYIYNHNNIISQLQLAIIDKSNKINNRIEIAKKNTWKDKGEELEKLINSILCKTK